MLAEAVATEESTQGESIMQKSPKHGAKGTLTINQEMPIWQKRGENITTQNNPHPLEAFSITGKERYTRVKHFLLWLFRINKGNLRAEVVNIKWQEDKGKLCWTIKKPVVTWKRNTGLKEKANSKTRKIKGKKKTIIHWISTTSQ